MVKQLWLALSCLVIEVLLKIGSLVAFQRSDARCRKSTVCIYVSLCRRVGERRETLKMS